MEKPSIDDYYKKLNGDGELGSPNFARVYDSVANKILNDFEQSDFWNEFLAEKVNFEEEYFERTNCRLFQNTELPTLVRKPMKSFKGKVFRQNVSFNRAYPKPPRKKGFVSAQDCYERINDIVRSTIVVQYLDGVEFLLEKLEELGGKHGIIVEHLFEARDQGYYSAHCYIKFDCEIPDSISTKKIRAIVELQISTQMQQIMKKMLRKFYEQDRLNSSKPQKKWQWDFEGEKFSTNYLSHIMHYVEGRIVALRRADNGIE